MKDVKKSHSEELHDSYPSPDSRVFKPMRKRRAGHMACVVQNTNACRGFMRDREGRKPLGRPTHRWEDNIKQILKKEARIKWTVCTWLRIRTNGTLLGTINNPSSSIKRQGFLD